jgi:hypothetical protein
MTADAITFERAIATDSGPAFLEFLMQALAGQRGETVGELGARYRKLVIGTAEPLRQACSEKAFREAYSVIDGGDFLRGFLGIVTSSAFPEMIRRGQLYELAPRRSQPRNQRAFELLEDLRERGGLLFGPQQEAKPDYTRLARSVTMDLDAGDPSLKAMGGYLACSSSLGYAAFGPVMWEPWQLGLLWTFGERALKSQAAAMGLAPEAAAAKMMTRGDRELMARTPDRASSDEGLALLGLDS